MFILQCILFVCSSHSFLVWPVFSLLHCFVTSCVFKSFFSPVSLSVSVISSWRRSSAFAPRVSSGFQLWFRCRCLVCSWFYILSWVFFWILFCLSYCCQLFFCWLLFHCPHLDLCDSCYVNKAHLLTCLPLRLHLCPGLLAIHYQYHRAEGPDIIQGGKQFMFTFSAIISLSPVSKCTLLSAQGNCWVLKKNCWINGTNLCFWFWGELSL